MELKNVLVCSIQEKFRAHMSDKLILGGNPPHYHTNWLLYLLMDGEFEFCIEEKRYTVKSGDLLLIPPRIICHRICPELIAVSRGVVYFDASFLDPSMAEIIIPMNEYLVDVNGSLDEVKSLFNKLVREGEQPDEFSGGNIRGYISELISIFFRMQRKGADIHKKSSPTFVEASISFIKNNYTSHITLVDAAKYVSVSSKYLSRTFKKEIGINFKEYLNLYRLKQSERMILEQPEKSILEIAYDNGFEDSNYFSACFKKQYGVTPSVFKKTKNPQ